MSDQDARLSTRWREKFEELESFCPWAGPRPLNPRLDSVAPYRFVARTHETMAFLNLLNENTLIVFHGESGAGKTSLLQMGLTQALVFNSFAPFVWRSWGGLGNQDPEEFLTRELAAAGQLHPAVIAELEEGRGLIDVLDELYGSRAVLVLDQFESLIRLGRGGFNRVAEWILSVNRGHTVRIVISLRSEYQHRLAKLIHRAKPFTTAYLELGPMDRGEQIERVILAPAEQDITSITGDAAGLLMTLWHDAVGSPSGSAQVGGEPGMSGILHEPPPLLAVQACLYALHQIARQRVGAEIAEVTEEDITVLVEAAKRDSDIAETRFDLFGYSFDLVIEGRLTHCMEACEALDPEAVDPEVGRGSIRAGVPAILRSLTRGCVIDAVDHLSSGGYKLERSIGDLLLRSKDREFRLAQWPRDDAMEAAQALVSLRSRPEFDYLAATREDLARILDWPIPLQESSAERDAAAHEGVQPVVPWLDDPDDVSAGAMLGFPSGELFLEVLRAFVFAIDWLETASIIEIVSGEDPAAVVAGHQGPVQDERGRIHPQGRTVVSLVHDGFGPALEAWATRVGTEPWIAVSSLVAFEGRRFDWASRSGAPFQNSQDNPRYLVNTRWRYCRIIGATFRSVVFMNCDFRGAIFQGCSFEGVTFVNCLLDGAVFERCTILGPTNIEFDFDAAWQDALEPPAEVAPAPPELVVGQDSLIQSRPEKPTSDLPSFIADGSDVARLVIELQWYRGERLGADCVYSPTSGVAAVPSSEADSISVSWYPQEHGLAMYGGRLSSLLMKDCVFSGGGQLALCHMAGSSLDLVEQGSGDVLLYYTTVRGVAVTEQVEDAMRDPGAVLRLDAYQCVLADAFFGDGLKGAVHILDSMVFGLSNASDSLAVTVNNCATSGADNVAVLANSPLFEGFGTGAPSSSAQALLAEKTERMTYRSVPARLEIRRRSAAAHD